MFFTGCGSQSKSKGESKTNDGVHGMFFQTFKENLMLTLHSLNISPNERPKFIKIIESKGRITVLDNELSNQET